jgi:hypothetical protein
VLRAIRGERSAVEELAAYLGPVIQARVAGALWRSCGPDLPLREDVSQRAHQLFAALFTAGARLLRGWETERRQPLRSFVADVSNLPSSADAEEALLERYTLGQLTPADRRELERRASSDRDFANRVELYRPLDTYERRVLAARVFRESSAPKTRRRPLLVTIGALVSAAFGFSVIARGCGR